MRRTNSELSQGDEVVRILNWNISHGGGSRIRAICDHVEDIRPDLLALTEFQTRNELLLRAHLQRLGYPFIATSNPSANQNGLLVASKWRLDHTVDQFEPKIDRERWLAVRVSELDLDILVLHIPGTPDNKFEDGYGISGAKRKELLWARAVDYAIEHRDHRAIMMGDFNTGFRIDTEGAMFRMSHYMTDLINTGFVDSWRYMHPDVREFTWYSKRKDKTTGKSLDLNGFRLDYIFVSSRLRDAVADVAILHEPRRAGISDHASLIADIDVHVNSRDWVLPSLATSAVVSSDAEFTAVDIVEVERGSRPADTEVTSKESLCVRLDLAPGSLDDMKCGLNGQGFVHYFRPMYVTAEWASGVLKSVQIWGPQLLKDGSLGKRELDHKWKRPVAAGGVQYSELPPLIAARLKSWIAGNGGVVSTQ
ncbi:endonuclease/exonuclease/phosphatase [Mycobacterium avium subsp. hominissuis]|nr:endonuclease/exonuclease/phosphatase [Mycobacterium avium subsp. hominissuis]MBZ4579287.1 endonuclease/exonuclease/phosphatase [Mycobacterium avium subsp. hominissuis]MBZ4594909.1 endonuclease/exonuclease/phosphatase [Mycobacterium avium subsp. hominissuis]MBZ4607343.1 endonuclease/exonuclease/phosphatase [Mycobacterium avium subsp. hominissuis]MBZ4636270.1 endonuclease/exonuclease/phosphatase [Mycobacterium avium subsp. hominissuis]